MAAANGSVYGIPYTASRVVKIKLNNPVDKSFTHIGHDFGRGRKCANGTKVPSLTMASFTVLHMSDVVVAFSRRSTRIPIPIPSQN